MKSVVITGVSSGIGYGATVEFINKGYRVFGSVRKKSDALRLKEELGDLFEPLCFDLTDYKAIESEAVRVAEILGNHNLSGIINNAGEVQGGPLMHLPLDIVRKSFDVLVFGQLAVTKAFLPLLGATSSNLHKPGRILMISSTSGKNGFPFTGPYAGAKHALEGISKSLRIELQIYGIEVIVVGPGNIQTPLWRKQEKESINHFRDTNYFIPLHNMHRYLKENIPKESITLRTFSKKLVQIFELKNPKTRYTIVKYSFKHWVVNHLISERIRNKLVAHKLGLLPLYDNNV